MQSINDISEELTKIFKTSHHKRKIEKGTYLFQEGMLANELFIIQSGIIQISKIVPDGRELTLRMCSKGDLIGDLSLYCRSPKHMLNAKVMESGEVLVIFQDELEEQLKHDHALTLELMKYINLQYQKTQSKFRDLVLHGKKGALYSTLIRLSNSYGEKSEQGILIKTPLTNQELANFCGTSREVVNRMLGDLRKNKIISIDKGLITIHSLAYLKTEIDCENCPINICNIE
ncbi:Crp/Fnr family transcriptional regulator [Bacillus sp. Bva_UNVM-123]|uniref:Crp/Fnr family transcriptional regulator n=1 Tax=Bacillus sp. Bva_UNVM-123 TaxID=2829798 RepID=UPI00391F3318